MEVLEWITTALLVLAMVGIGGMKLVGNETGIEQAVRLGYDKIRIPIGIAEVAAVSSSAPRSPISSGSAQPLRSASSP